jgi:hypothetical protein
MATSFPARWRLLAKLPGALRFGSGYKKECYRFQSAIFLAANARDSAAPFLRICDKLPIRNLLSDNLMALYLYF